MVKISMQTKNNKLQLSFAGVGVALTYSDTVTLAETLLDHANDLHDGTYENIAYLDDRDMHDALDKVYSGRS